MHTECLGCHKTFSRHGYAHHVMRTQRPRCRAVHDVSGQPSRKAFTYTASLPGSNTISNISGVNDGTPEDTNAALLSHSELTATYVTDDGKILRAYVMLFN